MRKKVLTFSAIVVLALSVAACAQRPTENLQAADKAVADARTDDVKTYAPDSYKAVEKAYADMQTEVEAQDAKFSMTRSYGHAIELAKEVQDASSQAIADAVTGKEAAKAAAAEAIQKATETLEEAKTMLAQAPTGKGTKADIDAMKADLAGAETVIQEAQTAFDSGAYHDVTAKTDTAIASAEKVKGAVRMAIELRSGSRQNRS